jgi:mannobiose 2-epimerase
MTRVIRKSDGPIDCTLQSLAARRAINALDPNPYVPEPHLVGEIRRSLEKTLHDNIIPFWFPRSLDTNRGGYRFDWDDEGQRQDAATRSAVGQARVLWFAARLLTSERVSGCDSDWAHHGFACLRDRFWDQEHGGFFWAIDAQHGRPCEPHKHLYAQAFGLFALSEYAIATSSPDARAMADVLFARLERSARDETHGGYRESFLRDWRPADPEATSYLGVPAGAKQLNTHLHLLEAVTRYAELADDPMVDERLAELVAIQSSKVVRDHGSCTDLHHADWSPYAGNAYERVTYGHDLENVWLLIEARQVLGDSNPPMLDLYETLAGNADRYGWDSVDGGYFYQGSPGKPADRRRKIWWVQAEALVCALWMYALTGRKEYFQRFRETLAWIEGRQIDWAGGDWFLRIDADGRPSGDKGQDRTGAWKTPYHNGRAIVRCLELLGGEDLSQAAGS